MMGRADTRSFKPIPPEIMSAMDAELSWYPDEIKNRLRAEYQEQQAWRLMAEKPWRNRAGMPLFRSIEDATDFLAMELYMQEGAGE